MEQRLRAGLAEEIERETAELYKSEAAGLLRYAIALGSDPEMARDAVQEAFCRFFLRRSASQPIDSPRGWLIRVARNYVLDQMRAGARKETSMDAVRNLPDPAELPRLDAGIWDRLQAMPDIRLSLREMECIRLRMEDLPYEAIAGTLGVRPGTVGALLARAHGKIRKAVNGGRRMAMARAAKARKDAASRGPNGARPAGDAGRHGIRLSL